MSGSIRVYDLARELKQKPKRIIEELRREGADVSVPSNLISNELAEMLRNRYFPPAPTTPQEIISKTRIKKIPCSNCATKTKHEILFSIKTSDFDNKEEYFVFQCAGCEAISFRKALIYKREPISNIGILGLSEFAQLYPIKISSRQKLEHTSIPQKVAQIYEETHIALSNNLLVLAGIGIRTLIEAICDEKGAIGRNLKEKIDNLADNGFLTKKNAENLQKLRIIGNEAAHKVSKQSEKLLNTAMDIIEHLLKGEFVLELTDETEK